MISRQNVLNTLAFLIVSMIFINLYTFVLMMSTVTDEANHRFIRRPLKNRNIIVDKNNVGRRVPYADKNPDDINVNEVSSKSYTTVRFVRRNGKMFFYEDSEARPLSLKEQNDVFRAVMRKLESVHASSDSDVNLTIRILGRVRRAFVGTDSAFGKVLTTTNPESVWRTIEQWPFSDQVFLDAMLGQLIQFASHVPILQAKSSRRGTQLKLNLILEGGQVALFKPKWYPSNIVQEGDVYGGKDRHFGEIAAFYLSLALGYNTAPITVGRTLNLKEEVLPVSTNQLKKTFFYDKRKNHCFYGVCYYCSRKDPVCGEGELIEGALVLLMGQQMKTVHNPWARTYKTGVAALWQSNMSYCHFLDLKKVEPKERKEFILDIIAVSVFDFLIGNGDRHHFDVLNDTKQFVNSRKHRHSKRILLIDNGKSFGNPYEDYVDILAPLYQCCRIRESLWTTLQQFLNNDLGAAVDSLSKADPLYPLLTSEHLTALNERLKIVVAVVEYCIDKNSFDKVIIKTND